MTEAKIGLDFLNKNWAIIDLASKELQPLQDPESAATTRRRVRAGKMTEIPPYSMVKVTACLDQPMGEEISDNCAPTQALMQPRNDAEVPVATTAMLPPVAQSWKKKLRKLQLANPVVCVLLCSKEAG